MPNLSSPTRIAAAVFAVALLLPNMVRATRASVIDQVVAAACDKELVMLGELPSHGEANAFGAKAEIVTALVETCGFDTVVFEAPVYEFEALRRSAATGLPSSSAFDNAIGGFWTTGELAHWRAWLLDQAAKGRVRVGGMDDQPAATSELTRRVLPELIADGSHVAQGRTCAEAVSRHLTWAYSAQTPFDAAEKDRLVTCVQAAHDRMAGDADRMDDAVLVAAFLAYVSRQTGRTEAPSRDASMFEAVKWHQAASPSGRRLVIWTSSVHSARKPGGRTYVPLGSRLAERHGSRMLSVGFTAAEGTTAMAGSAPKLLEPAPADALEALALGPDAASVYLDKEALKRLDGKLARVYGPFSAHAWSEHFDGMVIFRTEVAPSFPRRK